MASSNINTCYVHMQMPCNNLKLRRLYLFGVLLTCAVAAPRLIEEPGVVAYCMSLIIMPNAKHWHAMRHSRRFWACSEDVSHPAPEPLEPL